MRYELINPSDQYTFLANNLEEAALTVFSLSTAYGAKAEKGNDCVPIFLFGGAREWYQESFGRTPDEGLEAKKNEVAASLNSVTYGNFEDRRIYEAAISAITDPEKLEEFKAAWQNRSSSLNDIGTYAHKLAKRLMD